MESHSCVSLVPGFYRKISYRYRDIDSWLEKIKKIPSSLGNFFFTRNNSDTCVRKCIRSTRYFIISNLRSTYFVTHPPRKNVYYIIHDTRFSQPLWREITWSERERERESSLDSYFLRQTRRDSRLGLWFRECWYIAKDFAFRIRDKRVAWKKSASRKPGSKPRPARKTCVHQNQMDMRNF